MSVKVAKAENENKFYELLIFFIFYLIHVPAQQRGKKVTFFLKALF